ncbi:MAG: hypothetical protein RLZZ511_4217 [Cyanobacteriota bacterium]|jgi:hypothetical protein
MDIRWLPDFCATLAMAAFWLSAAIVLLSIARLILALTTRAIDDLKN